MFQTNCTALFNDMGIRNWVVTTALQFQSEFRNSRHSVFHYFIPYLCYVEYLNQTSLLWNKGHKRTCWNKPVTTLYCFLEIQMMNQILFEWSCRKSRNSENKLCHWSKKYIFFLIIFYNVSLNKMLFKSIWKIITELGAEVVFKSFFSVNLEEKYNFGCEIVLLTQPFVLWRYLMLSLSVRLGVKSRE